MNAQLTVSLGAGGLAVAIVGAPPAALGVAAIVVSTAAAAAIVLMVRQMRGERQ